LIEDDDAVVPPSAMKRRVDRDRLRRVRSHSAPAAVLAGAVAFGPDLQEHLAAVATHLNDVAPEPPSQLFS
jgi:hypothetical protein